MKALMFEINKVGNLTSAKVNPRLYKGINRIELWQSVKNL
jgi:hypothetical protein